MSRVAFVCTIALLLIFIDSLESASAQAPLKNGNLEAKNGSGQPDEWAFITQSGQKASLDSEEPAEGESAALLDCTDGANRFTNLMQVVSAKGYQGKRVRFRASVRTADLTATTRVQLWFRVDLQEGMGEFDNMQDRPITGDDWQPYDVVLDVAEDASDLNVGMFVIGSGKAWIDDASLTIVGDDVEKTGRDMSGYSASNDAPTQPFWTPWFFLVAVALFLFGVSQRQPSESGGFYHAGRWHKDGGAITPLGWLPKFGLRFACVYWFLYSFPTPFLQVLGLLDFEPCRTWLTSFATAYDGWMESAVQVVANGVGLEFSRLPMNGSGDTTYDYLRVLTVFLAAITLATVWSWIDWRKTDYRRTNDLLRSFVRYVLAATMIGYGLAKTGTTMNQFPTPGDGRLGQAFGDASPMGLLWTFMGASRSYTRFAGLGEIIGGLLLFFRRTSMLGAIVVFGVMLNVFMMNMCYDVPVKQYSFHLLVMAAFLLLADARRLIDTFVLNRNADAPELGPVYHRGQFRWLHTGIKVMLILALAVVPIGMQLWQEATTDRPKATAKSEKLLMRRGFRWINEVPFNR